MSDFNGNYSDQLELTSINDDRLKPYDPYQDQLNATADVHNQALRATNQAWNLERQAKKRRAFAKMASGLARMMHDDPTITMDTTVRELIESLTV